MDGWIKISRNIVNHWIWQDEKRLKWWLDLLFGANWEDCKVCVRGHVVEVHRGQLIGSSVSLAKKWDCNRKTAANFLQTLKNEGMITDILLDNQINVITICNYEEYQSGKGSQTDNQIRKQTDNIADRVLDNNKRNKERKNIKKEPPKGGKKEIAAHAAALYESRKEDFYNSLTSYVSIYGQEMVRAFFDYWTEPNKSHTQMRFELERTWDVERRLRTWASREKVTTQSYGNGRTDNQSAEQRATDAASIIARLAAEDDARR